MPQLGALNRMYSEVVDEEQNARFKTLSNANNQIKYYDDDIKPIDRKDIINSSIFDGLFQKFERAIGTFYNYCDNYFRDYAQGTDEDYTKLAEHAFILTFHFNNMARFLKKQKLTNQDKEDLLKKMNELQIIDQLNDVIQVLDLTSNDKRLLDAPENSNRKEQFRYYINLKEELEKMVKIINSGLYTTVEYAAGNLQRVSTMIFDSIIKKIDKDNPLKKDLMEEIRNISRVLPRDEGEKLVDMFEENIVNFRNMSEDELYSFFQSQTEDQIIDWAESYGIPTLSRNGLRLPEGLLIRDIINYIRGGVIVPELETPLEPVVEVVEEIPTEEPITEPRREPVRLEDTYSKKNLKKLSIIELNDLANQVGIVITKPNGKQKSKTALVNEIFERRNELPERNLPQLPASSEEARELGDVVRQLRGEGKKVDGGRFGYQSNSRFSPLVVYNDEGQNIYALRRYEV